VFDAKRLLTQMFETGRLADENAPLQTRAEVQRHLGDDPFASIRAITRRVVERFAPTSDEASSPEQARAMLLVHAMIAAAKADGEVDPEERARIVARLKAVGCEESAQRFIEEELAKPLDLYAITAEVRDVATAAEVYTASVAALQVDTEAERRYLETLALRLGLDRAAVEGVHTSLGLTPMASGQAQA
jgi:uncharacterized membrane protein YebE (DUF533 family)